MVRVYFNSRAEAPLVWSVDRGAGTEERKVREVSVLGTFGRTCYQPENDNEASPRAWIEFPKAMLAFDGDVAVIS